MDIAIITELIGSFGFPIVCVIALGCFVWKIYNKSVDRESVLMNEIKENREINARAIETIAQYAEKLDTIQRDIADIKTDLTILTAEQ